MKGTFVTFEGIECCGKSTQVELLAKRLIADGMDVLVTREPGGTALGEIVRRILCHSGETDSLANQPPLISLSPLAELLLFEASRAQHVCEKILPALEAGKVVICDRFTDSTAMYQGNGRSVDAASIKFLNDFVSQNCMPDLTVFIDVPVKESLNRIAKRDGGMDRIESEGEEFFSRVRMGYLKLAVADRRFVLIDGTGDSDYIHDAIFYEFAKRFLPRCY
jgi:dTMP kinase